MRKFALAITAFVTIWASACSSLPSIPDVSILGSSKNQRTYQADYDTTFRAAVDALRQIDNGSAKLVKYSTGTIVFQQPNDAGTMTANVTKVDEKTTRVELSATKERKYWLDANDEKTRDAFFAELDKRLGIAPTETQKTPAQAQPAAPAEPKSVPATSEAEHRSQLVAKLTQELQLGEDGGFLGKLSENDLTTLDQKLQAFNSGTKGTKEITTKCATCYIDLARLYHDEAQYARSAEALKIAVSVDPNNAAAHCNLGEVYKHLNLTDDAIRELNEAARLNPALPDTYINLGIIYDDYVIDHQKALENYKKYLELGGTDKQVLEWISAIEKGS